MFAYVWTSACVQHATLCGRQPGQNASLRIPKTLSCGLCSEKSFPPSRLISFDKLSRAPTETILLQTATIVRQLFNLLDVCKTRCFCSLGAWAPPQSAAVQCAIDLEHHSELQEHHNIEQWTTSKWSTRSTHVYPSSSVQSPAFRNTELTWLTWNSALGLKCLGSAGSLLNSSRLRLLLCFLLVTAKHARYCTLMTSREKEEQGRTKGWIQVLRAF